MKTEAGDNCRNCGKCTIHATMEKDYSGGSHSSSFEISAGKELLAARILEKRGFSVRIEGCGRRQED